MEGEVGKTRLAEYNAIKKKVDAKAERLTRKELNMPKGEWWFGSCHTFWKHKKKKADPAPESQPAPAVAPTKRVRQRFKRHDIINKRNQDNQS